MSVHCLRQAAQYFCTHHGARVHEIDKSHLQDASLPELDRLHSEMRTQNQHKENRSFRHHFARDLHVWRRTEPGKHALEGALSSKQIAVQCEPFPVPTTFHHPLRHVTVSPTTCVMITRTTQHHTTRMVAR